MEALHMYFTVINVVFSHFALKVTFIAWGKYICMHARLNACTCVYVCIYIYIYIYIYMGVCVHEKALAQRIKISNLFIRIFNVIPYLYCLCMTGSCTVTLHSPYYDIFYRYSINRIRCCSWYRLTWI